MNAARSLRPARADDLGLRRALSGWLLPLLSAAMVFLAALTLAGAMGAAALAGHWSQGAAATVTVTAPEADTAAVTGALSKAAGVADSRRLSKDEIAALIRPWLGVEPQELSLRLPAVFQVRLKPGASSEALAAVLKTAAPAALAERNGDWLVRVAALVRSVQACAALALLVVALTAAAVVGVASRAGLAARRDAVDIVHGLGATDAVIASQFSRRISILVLTGAIGGVVLALPVLVALARLAAPFAGSAPHGFASIPPMWRPLAAWFASLPPLLWAGLALLPLSAGLIGWLTAQATVRLWLRRLP